MSNIIAIDTGKRGCGVAYYKRNLLVNCGYPRIEDTYWYERRKEVTLLRNDVHVACADAALDCVERWTATSPSALVVAIELPRIYRGSQHEKDQNDLLDLAAVAGIMASALRSPSGETNYVHVSDWKGQLDKVAAWHHIQKRLSADEKAVYEAGVRDLPQALHHNVQDAVGIGLWACGRF